MPGFDFGQIGGIVGEYMDTDYMDVYRASSDTRQWELVAENVLCHASIQSPDEPNAAVVDVVPIVTNIRVHMALEIDVQYHDMLMIKRATHDGRMIIAYKGVCGHPAVTQGRKSVDIQMNSTVPSEALIPLPHT